MTTRQTIEQRYSEGSARLASLVTELETLHEQIDRATADGRDDEADALDLRARDVEIELHALGPEIEHLGFALDGLEA